MTISARVAREGQTAPHPAPCPGSALDPRNAGSAARTRGPAAPPRPPLAWEPAGRGGSSRGPGQGGPTPWGCAPLPAGPPRAAPRLPVVAVIFERREVLLQLPVGLLQPLAQVLELAAERGLEGRVLGIHARAAPPPALPAGPPRLLLPPLRPLYRFLRPLSLPSSGDRGLPARWAGPRRRSRWRGRWGGGAEDGGGRCVPKRRDPEEGSRPGGVETGSRSHRPAEGPKEERVTRPSAASRGDGGGTGKGRSNTRSSLPRRQCKDRCRRCSCWEGGETGDERREERGGRTRALSCWEGQRPEAAPAFSTTDSPRNGVWFVLPLSGLRLA